MKYLYLLRFLLLIVSTSTFLSCQQSEPSVKFAYQYVDETQRVADQQDHENPRMQFKLFQPQLEDRQALLSTISDQLDGFSQADYERITPLVYEQSVSELQKNVREASLSYQEISQWYLFRIGQIESDPMLSLNAVIAINPDAINKAKACDKGDEKLKKGIYGLPVMLKDNIGTESMPTTAGADILRANHTTDAFITAQLKEADAIILGKLNLSEWAYYFCQGCPLGYSAVGGQTLNPYGPALFETGGSSAGSGVAIAANYAPLTIGTETAGSILSPASKNAAVGLKPTIGLLSRSGIVPISKHLDTPGPITKTVMDAAILLDACTGEDPQDDFLQVDKHQSNYADFDKNINYESVKLGYIAAFKEDSIYMLAIDKLKELGAVLVEVELVSFDFTGYGSFLNYDMKEDLPHYMKQHAGLKSFSTVSDVIEYNLQDTIARAPYGQGLFEGIRDEGMSKESFDSLKHRFFAEAEAYFSIPMERHDLKAIISINNYSAAQAAMARFPALTVNSGFTFEGEPQGITFIGRPFSEKSLFSLAYTYEQGSKQRKAPRSYAPQTID